MGTCIEAEARRVITSFAHSRHATDGTAGEHR